MNIGNCCILFLLLFSFIFGCNDAAEHNREKIPESVFPTSGDSGLRSAESVAGEKIKALAQQVDTTVNTNSANTEIKKPAENNLPEQTIDHSESDAENQKPDNLNANNKIGTTAKSPFTLLPNITTNPLSLYSDANGNTWIIDSKAIYKYNPSINPGTTAPETVIDSLCFDKDFNDDMPKISTATIFSEDEIWVSFENGLLISYKNKHWQQQAPAGEPFRQGLKAITRYAGKIFVGGQSVYYFDSNYNKFVGEPILKNEVVTAMSVSLTDTLLVGSTQGLWEHNANERSWNLLWKLTPSDSVINAIHIKSSDEIILGTNNGLIKLSSNGIVSERLFQGLAITSISRSTNGNILLGTKESGIRYFDGKAWNAVGESNGLGNRISATAIDTSTNLYVAATGFGVFTGSTSDALTWLSSFPDQSLPKSGPEEFSDFCDAASNRLRGVQNSRDIAIEELDGKSYVFVRGVQECPRGLGFRRRDGFVLLVTGWQATFFNGGTRTDIQIPKDYKIDQANFVIFDSKNRLWFSLPDEGLVKFEGQSWSVIGTEQGMSNNPVSSFIEDLSGALWIGTRPSSNYYDSTRSYNLHLVTTDGQWVHFGPNQGLSHNITNSLDLLAGGSLFVGTNAGFSLISAKGDIVNYTQKQELNPFFIYTSAIDRQGRIWMGHQYYGDGVSIFDGENIFRLTKEVGLFNDKISKIAFDDADRVWLTSTNGRVSVYPIADFDSKKIKVELNKSRMIKRNLFGG